MEWEVVDLGIEIQVGGGCRYDGAWEKGLKLAAAVAEFAEDKTPLEK
jgi:hypothetical protein